MVTAWVAASAAAMALAVATALEMALMPLVALLAAVPWSAILASTMQSQRAMTALRSGISNGIAGTISIGARTPPANTPAATIFPSCTTRIAYEMA
ncbi:hypothetical protein C7I87_06150 [Mesorhizobium sp. SARCC-RB16n]|nr:hypothetical protein C7I87_06150 [Mesorhizobium sp. SARCC-RB16n]